MKKRFVIGVTGGLACGKSTVMALFKQSGIPGVSADDLAHDCIRQGQPSYKRIVHAFGRGVLSPTGEIDRQTLGAIVFVDADARKYLESLVHPCVIARLKRFVASHTGTIALDIPLLFEARLTGLVDHILVVTATREQQITRMKQRNGLHRVEALNRLRTQWPLSQKRRLADSVIVNTGSREQLQARIRRWIEINA